MKNDFLILGHGGSGTSLLRGLLNAHSRIECQFEHWGDWEAAARECKLIWGNKQPLERFWSAKWEEENKRKIDSLVDDFLIIWIVRRFKKWIKTRRNEVRFKDNWQKGRKIYWAMRNAHPEKIIEVSFEDLLLRPEPELRRVCAFLHIRYERRMLRDGVNDTGHRVYNYGEIRKDKI